jgi:hypothetical protein
MTAPEVVGKVAHHVRAVEKCSAGPQLTVSHPTLLDPVGSRRLLAQHGQQDTRSRGREPIKEASQTGHLDAATNGQKGRAVVPALADKCQLDLIGLILGIVGSKQDNVERWARLECVLDGVAFNISNTAASITPV